MDVGRRLSDSLRRFFYARNLDPPQGTRQVANNNTLRSLIESTVVSFVPSQLPLSNSLTQITAAQADFAADGSYRCRADIITSQPNFENMLVAIGFAFNVDGFGDGWVGPSIQAGRKFNKARFDQTNSSSWLRNNWDRAMAEGLSFGLFASSDSNMTLDQFIGDFEAQFNVPFTFMQDDQQFGGSEIANIIAAGGDPFEGDGSFNGGSSDTGQSFHARLQHLKGPTTISGASALLG